MLIESIREASQHWRCVLHSSWVKADDVEELALSSLAFCALRVRRIYYGLNVAATIYHFIYATLSGSSGVHQYGSSISWICDWDLGRQTNDGDSSSICIFSVIPVEWDFQSGTFEAIRA